MKFNSLLIFQELKSGLLKINKLLIFFLNIFANQYFTEALNFCC